MSSDDLLEGRGTGKGTVSGGLSGREARLAGSLPSMGRIITTSEIGLAGWGSIVTTNDDEQDEDVWKG